jgi:hypothetical protein
MGKAINKAVTIAEILKRKMPLHQITTLSSCQLINIYEPLEEGLDVVINKHYVSCLTITLSLDGVGMDSNDIGYQVSEVREEYSLYSSLFHSRERERNWTALSFFCKHLIQIIILSPSCIIFFYTCVLLLL